MNLLKCNKGHFYDGDKFTTCPFCADSLQSSNISGDSVTVSFPSGGSNDVTVAVSGSVSPVSSDPITVASHNVQQEPLTQKSVESVIGFADAMENAQNYSVTPDDDNRTVSYYSQKITQPVFQEPVVGWLVATKGKYFGQSFNLKSGRNFIGRSITMDVCLEGENSVSRERHAVIIYEPRERLFIAQPGDSRELFYINDEVVLDNIVLKPYDVISMGKVDMIIIPCCTKQFAWEDLAKEKE